MMGLFDGLQFCFEFGITKWSERQTLKAMVETEGGNVSWILNKKVHPGLSVNFCSVLTNKKN